MMTLVKFCLFDKPYLTLAPSINRCILPHPPSIFESVSPTHVPEGAHSTLTKLKLSSPFLFQLPHFPQSCLIWHTPPCPSSPTQSSNAPTIFGYKCTSSVNGNFFYFKDNASWHEKYIQRKCCNITTLVLHMWWWGGWWWWGGGERIKAVRNRVYI